MASNLTYDVIILGGGPAGVTAALRARELGATVALVERDTLGGTCTNDGCVPTRVLAKAARLMRETAQYGEYGLDVERPRADFARVIKRAQQVVYQIHEKKQLLAHLEGMKIATFEHAGEAAFADAHSIKLADGRVLHGGFIILCVGGQSRRLSFPGAERAMTHSDIWRMEQLPGRVAIVGGGATGCQLASIFNAFGTQVHLLDLSPRLLPTEDSAVSTLIDAKFRAHGIEILTGIGGVSSIEQNGEGLELRYTAEGVEQSRVVDEVILSVGWPGNIQALNLEAAGVATRGNYIQVDDALRTSVRHIYAAGDVTGRIMLVQTASDEARRAVENALLGRHERAVNHLVPHGGFTDPEYAGVGLTEEQAQQIADYAVAVVPYADMDRAVIDGQPAGFCKLIVARDTHLVIGAHVVGEQAVEVVQIVTTAMAGNMPVEKLAEIDYAYPTFSAIVGLAARQLARELGSVPVATTWRALSRQRVAEWERTG